MIEEWAIGLGASRRHLCADVGNEASQATVRRVDSVQEGVVRRCLEYRNGTRGDAALFARPAGD